VAVADPGVTIFVVRHAKAGKRESWDGDDVLRPLTSAGRQQADAIAARLTGEDIRSLWSSPYVRCVDTLAPLGRAIGLDVIAEQRLTEGTPFEAILELLRDVGDGAVLCSHGDVITDLIEALARRGTELLTPPDWRKATIWVLDTPADDGAVATATVEPPPASSRRFSHSDLQEIEERGPGAAQ
jgi:8-oxo-dGTP diphosphatase